MKKHALLSLGLASVVLSGCFASSYNANGFKGNAEKNEYSATVYDKESYKTSAASEIDVSKYDGFTNMLTVAYDKNDVVRAGFFWFFDSIDHVSAFFEKKSTKILSINVRNATDEEGDRKIGQAQNMCYFVTSKAVLDAVGFDAHQ